MKYNIYCLFVITCLTACHSNKDVIGVRLTSTLNTNTEVVLETKPCEYIFNGKDYRLNEYRIETKYSNLFNFTHNRLKDFYTDKHFMEVFASNAKIGDDNYIYLKVFFNSLEAGNTYGIIHQGEKMRVTLINDEKIYLESASSVYPSTIKEEQKTVYDGIFKASKSDIDLLKEIEIDKIGISWALGYEEYEISNIDLIKNQLHCLNQNQN